LAFFICSLRHCDTFGTTGEGLTWREAETEDVSDLERQGEGSKSSTRRRWRLRMNGRGWGPRKISIDEALWGAVEGVVSERSDESVCDGVWNGSSLGLKLLINLGGYGVEWAIDPSRSDTSADESAGSRMSGLLLRVGELPRQ